MDFPNCTEGGFAANSSSGNDTAEAPGNPPAQGKILLTLTLSVLAVLTTIINCLVISAIIVTRKLHHPANYLICSLAVTDLLVAVLVMPVSIVYIQKETWVMGWLVCTVWLSVDITCCTCSILHLATIALDRYRAITDAVAYARKRTGARAGAMIGVVWLLSVLISTPPLLWRHHSVDSLEENECIIRHHHVAFTLYTTLGAFYIPLLLILILYYKIYRAAQTLYMRREASRASRHSCMASSNGSAIPSAYPTGEGPRSPDPCMNPVEKSASDSTEERERDRDRVRVRVSKPVQRKSHWSESQRGGGGSRHSQLSQGPRISGSRERKAASTLGLILGAFVVCWLPFFIKEVIVNMCGSCDISTETADFLTWLGYLNSLINPLIYTIFNEDFKKAFQRMMRCNHYL